MAYIVKDKEGHAVVFKGATVLAQDNFEELEIKEFSDKERSFVAVANAESEDRFKDFISVKGWKIENYRKNPVVMGFHIYTQLPVGRSLEEWTRTKKGVKQLMFRPQFAAYPESIRMYEMYRDKYLKGFSVGFMPLKSEPIKGEGDDEETGFFIHQPTRYIKQELLENSVAPVPAHPDALSEIKGMVKKGKLYIPARYLQEDQGVDVEVYDEYIHMTVADGDKFTELYEDVLALGVVRVYGKIKDEEDFLVHKYIFSVDHFNEEQARDAVETFREEKFPVDGFVDYRIDKYSGRSSVQIDTLPTLLECNLDFDCKRKDLDIDVDEETEDKKTVICECLDCKHIQTTTKHCPEIKCSECGGEMRRIERPGSGKDVGDDDCIIGQDLEVGKDIDFSDEEYVEKDLVLRPYPNEHACRLEDPDDFDKFARKNCYRKSDGKCIDYIFGIKNGKSKAQALRYDKEVWTASKAKANCATHDGTFEAAGKMIEEMEGKIYIYRTPDVLEEKQTKILEESLKQKLGEDAVIIILDGGAKLELLKFGEVTQLIVKNKEDKNEDYKNADNSSIITIVEEKLDGMIDKIVDQVVERLKRTVKAVVRKEVDVEDEIDLEGIEEETIEDVIDDEVSREDISSMVSESLKESLGKLPD